MKHNELQIVTLKNRDPDILDHLFQIMCYGKNLFIYSVILYSGNCTIDSNFSIYIS